MADRFQFVSKDYVDQRIKGRIPKNTQKNTNWGVNTWNSWIYARNRVRQLGQPKFPSAEELQFIDPLELNGYLCFFVIDVRNKNGELYLASSLHQLLCGVARYLKEDLNRPDLNFFNTNNLYFNRFRQTLDSQIKLTTEQGIGTVKNQAQPITEEQEKCLWDKGLFNVDSSSGLTKVVYFYNCKVFGLRSRDEHQNLQAEQYTFGADECGKFITYHGRASKNITGGLSQRKVTLKEVKQYDTGNKMCVYQIFKSYLDKIGKTGHFYRKSLAPMYPGDVNFSHEKLSARTLSNYIGDVMKVAGYTGKYTGHSGKVTLATTLYRSGVDEQLIKERTGHRSDAVRQYKRTSSEQQKYISNIVDIPGSVVFDKENVCENKFTFKKPRIPNPVPLVNKDENVATAAVSEVLSDEEDIYLIDAIENFEKQIKPDIEENADRYIHKKFNFKTFFENETEMPNFDIGWKWDL